MESILISIHYYYRSHNVLWYRRLGIDKCYKIISHTKRQKRKEEIDLDYRVHLENLTMDSKD